jgi:hypothetical protein
MWTKLKTIITGKFNNLQQAEINAKVSELIAEKIKIEAQYIEKHTKDKYKIVKAFEFGGKQYFQFEDVFNVAVGRGMVASEYYNEFSMRCSREFLQAHCTAIHNAINNKNGIQISEIAKLSNQLKERLDLIFDVELMYKLASVIYFDENESPYNYDFKYNLEKIKTWKELKLSDFFLQVPMNDIIPLTGLSEQDLDIYTEVSKKINTHHLESIFTMLSERDKSKDFYKTIASQLNMATI